MVENAMRHGMLSSVLVSSVLLIAQTSTPTSPSSQKPGPETDKSVSSVADLSLDSSLRWTEAALADSSSLLPVERDFLLIRLAAAWNEINHSKSEEYLKTALDHIHSLSKGDFNAGNAGGVFIAEDVMSVDRKAWEQLLQELPARDASEEISNEAAVQEDVAETMNLEQKSLSHGGSYRDSFTLESLIEDDPAAAARLFDQMLSTASDPGSNPSLLVGLVERAFDTEEQGKHSKQKRFYNEDRRQRILSLLAQRALSQQESDACSYSAAAHSVIQQFPPAVQGQLLPVIESCSKQYGPPVVDRATQDAAESDSTDAIVRAMNVASEQKAKGFLRERAVFHAAKFDHDYERAIRLCLEVTQAEREDMPFPGSGSFDELAVNFASQKIDALRETKPLEVQRILDLLPPALKAEVEIKKVIRPLARKDPTYALLVLADARTALDRASPIRSDSYFEMLSETADLDSAELPLSWRVLTNGLNRFEQVQREKAEKLGTGPLRFDPAVSFTDPIYPAFISPKALLDESFVRASIADVNSAEYRASLRVGVVNAFLERYRQALKESLPKATPAGND